MTDQDRTETPLPSPMESTPGITPEEIIEASFGPFQRIRIICLDSRLDAMSSERNIVLHQNPTFEHVQQELATKEPEWTVLQPIYGPNPYWKHADQNSPIGATCRSLYAINRNVKSRYVLAVVRTSQSDRPVPILETPGTIIQAIIVANPDLENKIESFTRYSNLQDAQTELFDHDRLEERECRSFPTAFILTMREPPQKFQRTVSSATIPPFLQIPFVNCKNLLRSTYNLNFFPLQMIHVSGALLHAIICLAEAFKRVQTKDTSNQHPEDVREVALVLADELKQFLDSLTQIVKHGKGEGFNPANTRNTINQTFIALCGDYPGAVNIRRSGERFEELKGLDPDEAGLSYPTEAVRTVEQGPVVPRSEQDELIGRSDRTPVEPVLTDRPGAIPVEPAPVIPDSPAKTVERSRAVTPVEGFHVGEGGLDSIPAEKDTDGASQSFAKKAGGIESAQRFLKARKMQKIVPAVLMATSWAAPLQEFPGVAVESVDEGRVTNPVEELDFHDKANVPLIAANLSSQTIAHENITGDIERAISEYRTALETTIDGDSNKPMLLNRLAIGLESRFRRSDAVDDLQEAASRLQTAVELTLDGHPAKPALLTNLGNVLQTRFARIGDPADLERVISSLKSAAKLTPDGHPNKPSLLYSLGSTLLLRFRRLGNLDDLNQAISLEQAAMELTPDDYLDRHILLNNVGSALRMRFECIGDLEDIESAISSLKIAADLTPDGHPDKPGQLSNLGHALQSRFDRFGGLVDVEAAISSLRKAIQLTPDDHLDKPGLLNNLGHALESRFHHLGVLTDLEDALSSLRKAVQLTPDGHPSKPSHLINLGNALKSRFDCLGNLVDLENAISSLREVLQLTPNDHPDRPSGLTNLGCALQSRFDYLGDLADLEDAILNERKAIELTPDGHPSKPGQLSNLGNSLQTRFERLGSVGDLEDSISSLQQAVQLTPDGHPNRPTLLKNLGHALQSRFDRLGGLADLEDAISNEQQAIELTPDGHPSKPDQLRNLGISLQTRFERLGNIGDLEDSISSLRQAVQLTPDGYPSKSALLSNLGYALQSRFDRFGVLADLEDALSSLRMAVQLTPDGHPSKPGQLRNLGISFQTRFGRLGSFGDLEDSVSSLRQAVQLTPNGHPDQPSGLTNLGHALQSRFDLLGGLADLEDAILHERQAIELTPDGHPSKPDQLSNLGSSLQTRFERLSALADLEDATSSLQQAVQLTPDGHPAKLRRLNDLGAVFIRRFKHLGILSDLESGLYALSTAANSTSGSAMVRFEAARAWAKAAEENSRSPLDAFSCAINLLPSIAWLGLAVTDQHALLTNVGGVVRNAVAAAIIYEEYETAVVWAEQGRSIVWQNLLGLRNPVDDLREAYPELANRLRRIAAQLEGLVPHEPLGDNKQKAPVEDVSYKYSKLALEWENLIEEVRRLPTFEGFLKAKTFRQLAPAAYEGPVVILNVNDARCDALVLIADESAGRHVSAVSIPLERFSHEKSKKMFQSMEELLYSSGIRGTLRKPAKTHPDAKFKSILGVLWQDVVKPVIEGLSFQIESKRPPRIWWCATGFLAFLPIHAAGLYDTQEIGEKLSDYVVSSYTPTLTAILELSDPVLREDFQVLTVAQASPPGAPPIPRTEDEVRIVRSLVGGARVLNLAGENATVEHVREGMMESNWIHLACHARQNPDNPMESGFLLHDRIFKLSEIVKMSPPKADFAFLSACQTAMGDERLAEESVHLAAGMLLLGYRGVIATTWDIRDEDTLKIAEDVYSRIFKDGKPRRKEAAYALHEAVKRLRESGVQCTSWVPFIHIGR